MKTTWVGIAAVLLAASTLAIGQDYYGGGPYYDNRASTPAESAARGMSDVVRSAGQYNLATSAAAINMTEAQSKYMENREQYTSTYFQMRDANRQYRAAERGPKPTMKHLVRYAQAGKPQPLSPSELDFVTGGISWPRALQTPAFSDGRQELEQLFAKRAEHGSLGMDDLTRLRESTDAVLDEMKQQLKDGKIPQMEYAATKRFVKSLSYEGSRPVT